MPIRISFIIPLFNMQTWITPCLESIASSSFKEEEYEIIVWNDGSTDVGAAIVEAFAKGHKNVRLYNHDNHGVSYARNRALKLATGDYIWFVDADDRVEPMHVETILNLAKEHDLDMILFNWRAFDGYNYSPGAHPVTNMDNPIRGKELFLKHRLMLAPWCYIYKRSFLLNNNLLFDETFKTCEDIQFNQKALLCAKRVMTSSDVLYCYRLQSESASQGKNRAKKVLKDQFRRIISEIFYFGTRFECHYLIRVLYLNIREILLWVRLSIR